MFLTKTRKVQTRWLTGFSKTGTNYFLLYERERGHSCILDVFSLCVCWPRTPPLTQLSSLSIAHTLFILIEKEREREMSHSHIIHFSLKDTRIWSSLLVRPIDQSETTVRVRSRHNVLTGVLTKHNTKVWEGESKHSHTSVVFSLRILIHLSE